LIHRGYAAEDDPAILDEPTSNRELATVNNLLDAHVLRHGFRGVGGPRFYPAASRSAFVELRYAL